MPEENSGWNNPFDYLIDSFWAVLPEETANKLADCERQALGRIRETVNSLIDEDLKWLDRHLENARRMREQYRRPKTV